MVIIHKRERILRCAQNDNARGCHSERSEESARWLAAGVANDVGAALDAVHVGVHGPFGDEGATGG